MFVVPLRPKDAQALADLARQYYESVPSLALTAVQIPKQRTKSESEAFKLGRRLRAAIRI